MLLLIYSSTMGCLNFWEVSLMVGGRAGGQDFRHPNCTVTVIIDDYFLEVLIYSIIYSILILLRGHTFIHLLPMMCFTVSDLVFSSLIQGLSQGQFQGQGQSRGLQSKRLISQLALLLVQFSQSFFSVRVVVSLLL